MNHEKCGSWQRLGWRRAHPTSKNFTGRRLQIVAENKSSQVIDTCNILLTLQYSLGVLLEFSIIYFKLILNVNFCFLEQDGEGTVETLKNYGDKIQQLERELYFYKKTSRDLKKKLKELVGEAIQRQLVPSESKRFSVTCHTNTVAWFVVEPFPIDWIIQDQIFNFSLSLQTKIVVQSMCNTESLEKRINEQMYMCEGNDHLFDCLPCTRGSCHLILKITLNIGQLLFSCFIVN